MPLGTTDGRPPTNAPVVVGMPCSRAIVLDPARVFFGSDDPSPGLAQLLENPRPNDPTTSSFNVARRFEEDATVDAFKGLGQNRAIFITARSVVVPGFGVGLVTSESAGILNRVANAGDLVSNRLAITGSGDYAVTPKFFLHHNGDMDGAIVYVNATTQRRTSDWPTPSSVAAQKRFTGSPATRPWLTAAGGHRAFTDAVEREMTRQDGRIDFGERRLQPAYGGSRPRTSPATQFTFFGTGEAKLEAGCDLLTDNDLFVPTPGTRTSATSTLPPSSSATASGSCAGSGNEFMTFTGDNTSGGGSETVTIDLQGAFAAGRFTTGTMRHRQRGLVHAAPAAAARPC